MLPCCLVPDLLPRTWIIRWLRELNALQLQKTHANRKSTSKSRKHVHHFDSRWCKCSQHNQIHFICSAFLFWLCCEHLLHVCCQINESVFLICRCFFYLHSWELSSLGHRRITPLVKPSGYCSPIEDHVRLLEHSSALPSIYLFASCWPCLCFWHMAIIIKACTWIRTPLVLSAPLHWYLSSEIFFITLTVWLNLMLQKNFLFPYFTLFLM